MKSTNPRNQMCYRGLRRPQDDTVREITNAWVNRTLPDVFYEEPEPVEDGLLQELPIDHIKRLLWERYGERDDVFITNAVFIMYDRTNGNRRVQPDCMIVFDVDPAIIRERLPNYWIWEVGKPPDFVMEVVPLPARRLTIWVINGTCTPAWASWNTGGSTPLEGNSTGSRSRANVW